MKLKTFGYKTTEDAKQFQKAVLLKAKAARSLVEEETASFPRSSALKTAVPA